MAAPNIVNVSAIYSKIAVLAVTTSPTAIVSNAAASGKLIKVTSLIVCNVTTSVVTVDIDHYRSSSAVRIAKGLSIPVGCSVLPLEKMETLNLEEGDSLRLTASANSSLEAVANYEDIS